MKARVGVVLVLAASLAACGGPYSHFGRETSWPGSAVGRVVASTFSPSAPAVVGPDGKPVEVPIFLKGRPVPIRVAAGGSTPEHYHYQVQANDGTLLILQSDARLPVGACIAISGYADGPSMTHWSFGRAKVEQSADCKD
jgi:hypothetical protein